MIPYEIRDKAGDDRFYALAVSPEEAIERVTLSLADARGADAWEATPASPALTLVEGVVFDASGRPIRMPGA